MGAIWRGLFAALGLSTLMLASACGAPPADDDGAVGAEAAQTARTRVASDPRATPETQTVFANLDSFDFGSSNPFDHRVLVGQQEADVSNRTANGLAVVDSDIQKVSGKAPGLVSYELSNADKGAMTVWDPVGFRASRRALHDLVLDKHSKGALVSLVWHLRCPKSAASDPDKFSPAECPSDYRLEELLEKKSDGTKGVHFVEWRAMLDELAELLWTLKDERGELVPVQLRMFHELTGNWFWWGRQNAPSTYARVWREMVSYLRDGRGLHNVLWVFCPAAPSDSSTSGFEAYYPGDAYVDVIAFDRYDFGDGRFARGYEADLRLVDDFARAHGKVAAVAEVGTDLIRRGANADPTWFSRTMLAPLESPGRKLAYVSIWRNAPWEKFVPEPGDGTIAADLARVANDRAALFAGQHNLYLPLHVPPGM